MKTKSKTIEDIPGITTGNICGQQYDVAINKTEVINSHNSEEVNTARGSKTECQMQTLNENTTQIQRLHKTHAKNRTFNFKT